MTIVDFLVVVCSIFPLILLLSVIYIYYKRKRPLESLILFATFIHESILVSFPCIYGAFSDYKYESLLRFSVSGNDLLKVLLIENMYILFFLALFIVLSRYRPQRITIRSDHRLYSFFALVTIIGIIVYSYQIVNRPTIEQIVESYSQSGLVGSSKLISFFTITLEHSAIISATILSVRSRVEIYSKSYQYLGILMLVLVLFLVLVTGVRGRVIWVAEFVILISLFKRQLKPVFAMILLGMIFIPINSILVTQIRPISEEIAKEGGLTNQAILNIAKVIIEGVDDESKSERAGILESLADRAQGPRNSVALINEYEKGNFPGLNIYKGAILYFIPRFIIDRPVIGSPNGNFKDAGIFKIMDLNYPDNTFITMGPLLASAHAYWEGGFLGVILIAFASSLLWLFAIHISYKLPILLGLLLCLLICCSLLIDGFLSVLTPLYSQIAIFWKCILPLLALYFVYKKSRAFIPRFKYD